MKIGISGSAGVGKTTLSLISGITIAPAASASRGHPNNSKWSAQPRPLYPYL
jgi:hypothetical protein